MPHKSFSIVCFLLLVDMLPLPQNKQHLKRFMESILRLCTKLQSLRRDLKDNYVPTSTQEP